MHPYTVTRRAGAACLLLYAALPWWGRADSARHVKGYRLTQQARVQPALDDMERPCAPAAVAVPLLATVVGLHGAQGDKI